jgi:hypothetical protein
MFSHELNIEAFQYYAYGLVTFFERLCEIFHVLILKKNRRIEVIILIY